MHHRPFDFAASEGPAGRRAGFTLIELLVVLAVLAILAGMAMPGYGDTRERALLVVVTSDLKNFGLAQEEFRTAFGTYAVSIEDLDFKGSRGVELTVTEATNTGWSAVATHAALPSDHGCAVYLGGADPPALPDGSSHAVGAGVVECRR
jgi:type IV pilus assembly protein PilE